MTQAKIAVTLLAVPALLICIPPFVKNFIILQVTMLVYGNRRPRDGGDRFRYRGFLLLQLDG